MVIKKQKKMVNYKDLAKDTILVSFDKLCIDSKMYAVNEIISIEIEALNNLLNEYNSINIHLRINNKNKFKAIIRAKNNIKKMGLDYQYSERLIIENLCLFTQTGCYVRYI